ncbi:M42 family metallopeptidase [Priestia filamentosa]|uniref:M42 family metallopeptidase n=1 Tax=Priestia filamentosa TaxID=1402861 RepID=UPI0002E281A9|nr:M42 family metallopeptidase [Priestia filamentosa]MDT3763624.1 M42 family metallopeptidase [Priestia filamentosa]OXS71882.1 peptidase M28 [Priestia filamentosa]RJS63262.1 peptidase M28 [Priestia filamentosa]WCM14273.1 M42 family metallopeptidase [Priestia filamentosa]WRU94056.1 M42 family metallopeptidase [Priestia filamentosa]
MDLLKKLTETPGAPGFEKHVRNIMEEELTSCGAELVYDDLGSIFGGKEGKENKVKVMIAGHMDEVAFMVSEITKDGYLRFSPLGGWWDQVLLSQRVQIVTEKRTFTGVIGSKPPHILQPEERSKVYPIREMFIDIGAKNKEQVKEWGIHQGDPIIPICPFEMLPDEDTILAKALDNRAGCYLALQSLKELGEDHPNMVFAGATVQEEVGLRGAGTSPYMIDPDVAIVLDVGIAEDGPGMGGEDKPKLGGGPLISFLDASMIPNIPFRNLVIQTAEEQNISYQTEIMTGGGTDAGKIHLYKQGVPTIVISVAARYIHSHVSMVSKRDLEDATKLIVEVVRKLDESTVRTFSAE